MGRQTFILVTISILLFVKIVQTNAFDYADDRLETLSVEDQDVADSARLNVAETLENNLIKFFTLFVAANNEKERSASDSGGVTTTTSAAGKRGGFERQKDKDRDEEEEEEAEEITTSTTEATTTKKPSAFPQVVQILSAIFSGGLNLTNIVDRTFGLAPESLRNQVDGLFKLLTGQPPALTTTTTTKKPTTKPTTKKPLRRRTTTTTESENESELDYETELSDPPTTTTEAYKTLIRNRYKLNNRTRNTNTPRPGSSSAALMLLPDDEMDTIFRLEEKLVLAAIEAEPYVRDKEPQEFRGVMEAIIKNFDSGKLNVTQIMKFVPDLFEGARESILVLEKLGQIPGKE